MMFYFAIAPFAVFFPCLIVLLSRALRRPDRQPYPAALER